MNTVGAIASSVAKAISDLFTRTTAGALGAATSGNLWTAVRGVWYTNGTKAQSDNVATDYAMAVIPFGQNVTLSAVTSMGTGLVFWETSSGDWWATTPYSYTTTGSYCIASACCTGSNTCTYNACCTGTSGTTGPGFSCPDPAGCTYTDPCGGVHYLVYNTPTEITWNCCVANACCTGSNTCTYNACCSTGTSTTYNWAIKILKMIAGIFSQVQTTDITSSGTNTDLIAGIKTTTSGVGITVKAYSDAALTTQVGSTVTFTATGANTGTGVGIIKVDSANNQGSTLDNFTAN